MDSTILQLTARLDHCHEKPIDELRLPFESRKRGRLRAVTEGGREVGLFLTRGQLLATGDLLRATTGEIIRITSAPEPVVTAHCDDDLAFARICYHFGNRHVPLQIGPRWLRLQPDHVLEALISRFGLRMVHEEAPFEPENGAYHGQSTRGHHHHGDHDSDDNPSGDGHHHSHAHGHHHAHSH